MGREKKLILVIAATALTLVLTLSAFLSAQLKSGAPGEAGTGLFGLLNIAVSDKPTTISQEKRNTEYRNRLPLTNDIIGNFESKVMRFLSAGNFTDLDDWLSHLEGTYRDVEAKSGQDLSYVSLIQNYRSDIAIIQSFNRLSDRSDAAALLMKFQTPEVLAAAVLYAPLSMKLDSIIHQDSLILPAINERDAHLTDLKEVDLGPDEYMPRVEEINQRRASGYKVIGVTLFEFEVCGKKYRMEIVAQDDYTYAPYRIFSLEGHSTTDEPVTVAYLKKFRAEYSDYDWFDIDSFYVVASPTDAEGEMPDVEETS